MPRILPNWLLCDEVFVHQVPSLKHIAGTKLLNENIIDSFDKIERWIIEKILIDEKFKVLWLHPEAYTQYQFQENSFLEIRGQQYFQEKLGIIYLSIEHIFQDIPTIPVHKSKVNYSASKEESWYRRQRIKRLNAENNPKRKHEYYRRIARERAERREQKYFRRENTEAWKSVVRQLFAD